MNIREIERENGFEASNLKEKSYKIIKEKIISCEFMPGEFLNEKDLINEIGVSRTPIREALNRLEQENLIRIIPRRGVFVSDISIKDIMDIFQLRENIDPFITKLATPLASEEKLLNFKMLLLNSKFMDSNYHNKLDDDIHNYIALSCNNKYLIQMISNIYDQNQRIRILSTRLPQRIEESINEHLSIISCMLKRDEEEAANAMRLHIINSRNAAFKINYWETPKY